MSMKSIRSAVFLSLLTLTALPLFAAPQISVQRNWDNGTVFENDQVELGETPVNTPISKLFRIHNTGNQPLSFTFSFVGGDALSVIQQPTSPVPAGGYTTFRIRVYGNKPSGQYGYITIDSNAANDPSFHFSVHGTVIGPMIDLIQNWTGLQQPNGGAVDFGTIAANTHTSRAWQVYNSGNRQLDLTNASATVSGTGFVQIETPLSTLQPNWSSVLRVRFAPTQPNTLYTGQITIYSNDGPRNPFVVYLQGRSQ